LGAQGPNDAEMERGAAQAEAHFIYRLQMLGGFGGRSDQLNAYNVMTGDPGFYRADLQRYRSATRDRVGDAVARHLTASDRVVLSVVPRGRADLGVPGSDPVVVR
jgi:zinc protease